MADKELADPPGVDPRASRFEPWAASNACLVITAARILGTDVDGVQFSGQAPCGYGVVVTRHLATVKSWVRFPVSARGKRLRVPIPPAAAAGCYSAAGSSVRHRNPPTSRAKHLNNQLENLRILCGNCHMQTETWGFKNGRRRPTQALVA